MKLGEEKYGHAIGAVFNLPDGKKITGHITLRKGDLFESIVRICDDEIFRIPDESSLHGISAEGKVSLLDCWNGEPSISRWFYYCNLSFRYAVFGNRHLDIEEKVITGMRFTFDEIDEILSNRGSGTFGHITNPNQEIIDAIEKNKPEHQKGSLRIDGSASVSYFTGDHEILPETETVLGTIKASREIYGDWFGRNMKDEPYITIDFDHNPVTLDEAVAKMWAVRQFFAWMIGRAPRWKDIRVFTSKRDDDGYLGRGLEVFAPIERHETDHNRNYTPGWDVLIDASREPDYFASVMRRWLERNSNERRKRSNAIFFCSLSGRWRRSFEDDIISAANTFDHIPSSDKPSPPRISEEIRRILACTKDAIKELDNEEKGNILSQLGGIVSRPTLRSIVQARASIIHNSTRRLAFPNLGEAIKYAVWCRNHYTHGGGSKRVSNFSDPAFVIFLTDTLQFVYGAAELLTCGWSIDDWIETAGHGHPFSMYAKNYSRHIDEFGGDLR